MHGLGVFIPLALILDLAGASPALVFSTSALGVIPTAAVMSEATEQLAARSGPGIGGLVNVTFGNAPELIIAIFALADGLQEVVKASLVGSIIGNSLLVLGAAMLAGGWKRTRQTFDRTAAQTQTGMLLLTVVALALPSVLVLARHGSLPGVGEIRHVFRGADRVVRRSGAGAPVLRGRTRSDGDGVQRV
jgi:Ca2+:H+ antiporter